jgi:hypothetical protein
MNSIIAFHERGFSQTMFSQRYPWQCWRRTKP